MSIPLAPWLPPSHTAHREHAARGRPSRRAARHLPQVRLPPDGVPAPLARSSAAVAGGSPVVEALASTSLWAVATLKALCQV
jgi:hypothetical protein